MTKCLLCEAAATRAGYCDPCRREMRVAAVAALRKHPELSPAAVVTALNWVKNLSGRGR